ncbi:MAG: hypothetical protein EOM67_08600 [Spirochaetia bacterium]|nr:hypothetical protein [Spirochaetia bacterium]
MNKKVLILIVIILISLPLFSAFNLSTELSLMNTLTIKESTGSDIAQSGNILFGLNSTGYKNVKADVGVNVGFYSLTTIPTISLDRLTIKARFPSFRVTLGKTRLDWGEGSLFNAGNVLFEDTAIDIPLLTTSPILDRQWLGAITIALTSFSFFEGALIIPETEKLSDLKGGIRYYNSEGDVKVDAGLSIRNNALTPHLSVLGNIGLDASLSASFDIPLTEDDPSSMKESLSISTSLFYVYSFLNQDSLSLTLEALYTPFSLDATNTLFLYPVVQYALSNGLSFSMRSIISPIDMSASVSASMGWNIFDGLQISALINTELGESGDSFTYNDVKVSIGLTSLF